MVMEKTRNGGGIDAIIFRSGGVLYSAPIVTGSHEV